jgi:hypothetical protein
VTELVFQTVMPETVEGLDRDLPADFTEVLHEVRLELVGGLPVVGHHEDATRRNSAHLDEVLDAESDRSRLAGPGPGD